MKRKVIGIIIALLVIVAGTYVYKAFLGKTYVAFMNFQPVQMGEILRANNNPMIEIFEVSTNDIDDLDDYDMVFISGMGMKITEAQRDKLKSLAADGLPIMTFGAVNNPANSINNLYDDADLLRLYFAGGNRANYAALLNYVRLYIDGKIIYAPEPPDPTETADFLIYHPDPADPDAEEIGFNSVKEYEEFLQENGLLKGGAPHVIVTGMMGRAADIVTELERQNMVAYNVSSIRTFVQSQQIDSVRPAAIINMAHGRMGDYMVDYLTEKDIPLFAPLNTNCLAEQWEADRQGMTGGMLSQSVVTPEIDGAIRPYTLFAHYVNDNGIREVRAIPGRLEEFVETVANHIELRNKKNSDKHVVIVYFKGPGQSGLVASGMEVVPSLYNLLVEMKKEGYKVDGLPASWQGLRDKIKAEGQVFGTYAEGDVARYADSGKGITISAAEFNEWAKEGLSDSQQKELHDAFGNFPGDYMSISDSSIILPAVELGNVVLLPQLPAGIGGDSFKMTHGTKEAPPYPYVATYLWARDGFNADAIIHFGTHGSLEYTPSKQNALGSDDWSARLIGPLPHLYVYTIGNVGESLIAKRRSLATIQSHLTPPFKETELRQTYKKLSDAIDAYSSLNDDAPDAQRKNLAQKVKEQAHALGIDSELHISDAPDYEYTADDVRRLESYAEELANEKMTGTPYILGNQYSTDDIDATVMAMTAEPIAYSLLSLDKMRGRAEKDFERLHPSLFTRRYIAPAKNIAKNLLKSNTPLSDAEICKMADITAADLAKARHIDSLQRAPQSMMDMMTNAMQDTRNAYKMAVMMGSQSNNDSTSGHKNMSPAMRAKMKAMMRKMTPDEMLEQAKKMGAPPEALKKMEAKLKGTSENTDAKTQATRKSQRTIISPEAKDSARVILALETALKNVGTYRNSLELSPKNELRTIISSLNGGYTPPQPGGDPIVNPQAVPTGRNLYGINAEATPSETAWQQGVELARQTIDAYRAKHDGAYPRKVSYTLWSGEFIETQGATFAQVLYMLGVEPIRDAFGRVNDLRLIPSAELGRPRIDVTVQTSGQLRDLAATRLYLVTRAINMAADASSDTAFANNVAQGVLDAERYLVDKGLSPRDAREVARHRVFGAQNGGYGAGITGMVEKGDAYDERGQIADTYLNNMNAFYGDANAWEADNAHALEAALLGTDAIVQPRQSNTWGALSLDHVYEFTGGLSAAVERVTGKEPEAMMSDYRNHHHVRMQDLNESIAAEGRTTLFNPAYIKDKMKGGQGSAEDISTMVKNTFGWSAVRSSALDRSTWDRIYAVYVTDSLNLNVQQFFETEDAAALQEMTAVMLESARKGFWNASDEQIQNVAKLHTDLTERHGPSGSPFEADNLKLQAYIAQHAPSEQAAAQYRESQKSVREVQKVETADGKVLKKETVQSATDSDENGTSTSATAVIVIALVTLIVAIVVIRRRRQNRDLD